MSLVVETIYMHNFRNFEEKQLSFSPQITILHGRNAVGKTNTIEALQLITTGSSFRHPKTKELILDGSEQAQVKAHIRGDGRFIDIELQAKESSKTFEINGKRRRSSDVSGTLMSVLFCPDDLALVKGSASKRRDDLDSFGSQASKAYYRLVRAYQKTVEQRNHLLKDMACNVGLLDAWDQSLAVGAGTLLSHRLSLFSKLKECFLEAASELVPAQHVDVFYQTKTRDDISEMSKDELIEYMVNQVFLARAEDMRRQQTTVGPHRDDIVFLIDGKDARDFGSQGQQRALVLSWKMAQLRLAEKISGSPALLLLDDVMSELDDIRRSAVLSFFNNHVQTVISTTNLGYFSGKELKTAEVISYGE